MKRLTDLLSLSHVPRWAIVDHLKPQTVSDHVYRVLVIATEMANRLGIEVEQRTLIYILSHDASECRTGDIPTPAKQTAEIIGTGHGFDNDVLFCPWTAREPQALNVSQALLMALADVIEAATFIRRYGIGSHARRVEMDLCRTVNDRCPAEWLDTVRQLMQEMNEDAGR